MNIKKANTIHTARTMMFYELSKVMDFSSEDNSYKESLKKNVFGKKSLDGVRKTSSFLTQLYGFDITSDKFKAFKYFWSISSESEKALITFLFALSNDYLLSESISVISVCPLGNRVEIDALMENIDKYHPSQFTKKTLRSTAQNIASSWKQAGFIEGRIKNIRTQPEVTYTITAFGILLSYLNGNRGDYIFHSSPLIALCVGDSKLHHLAIEASKRDLIQYQHAGDVTVIKLDKLLKKIGIDAI